MDITGYDVSSLHQAGSLVETGIRALNAANRAPGEMVERLLSGQPRSYGSSAAVEAKGLVVDRYA